MYVIIGGYVIEGNLTVVKLKPNKADGSIYSTFGLPAKHYINRLGRIPIEKFAS